MKNTYLILSVFSLSMYSGFSFSQDQLAREYAPIKAELTSWDPIRGEWLAESMMAISKDQPIPDRTFPEDFTPAEMLRMVPQTNRQNIQNTIEANRTANNGTLNGDVWTHMSTFVQAPTCQLVKGRSHGDPHLNSFDGKSFSLQTVGEFVLTRSLSGKMEVQTRQRADGDDFSLNTAVAMNVAGDRVCIYADDKPDNDFSNPLRVDGQSVRVNGSTYYLPRGGNIRNTGNKYVITWPTGENVTCEINNRSKFNFINVSTQIYPCTPGGYEGLLGNANGSPDDDIDTRNNRYNYGSPNRFNTVFASSTMSNEAEKEYLHYLAKEFGHAWRVTSFNTLFDYAPGTNTDYYTDYTFPRYHRTVRDLSQGQRDAARRECENGGIRGNELEGCIFDRAYVNLPPTRTPEHTDPTSGVVLASLGNGPVRNVNPPRTGSGDAGSVKPALNPTGATKVPAGATSTTKVPAGSTGKGTKEEIEKPEPPVVISKPVGEGSNIGKKKPETKSPPSNPAGESTPSPVKESNPTTVSEPEYKPSRTTRPERNEPVYTAPKETYSAPKETYSAPKETYSAPEPVKYEPPVRTQPAPERETRSTPSSSGNISSPQQMSVPTTRPR